MQELMSASGEGCTVIIRFNPNLPDVDPRRKHMKLLKALQMVFSKTEKQMSPKKSVFYLFYPDNPQVSCVWL